VGSTLLLQIIILQLTFGTLARRPTIRRLWWEWVIWLMDCIWQRCLFLAEEVEPPLVKPPEMVLMVPRKGGSARVMSVRADSGC